MLIIHSFPNWNLLYRKSQQMAVSSSNVLTVTGAKGSLKNWENELKRLAIKAEQQFDYVAGKNATDMGTRY